jgi:hypothetical protein
VRWWENPRRPSFPPRAHAPAATGEPGRTGPAAGGDGRSVDRGNGLLGSCRSNSSARVSMARSPGWRASSFVIQHRSGRAAPLVRLGAVGRARSRAEGRSRPPHPVRAGERDRPRRRSWSPIAPTHPDSLAKPGPWSVPGRSLSARDRGESRGGFSVRLEAI